MTQQVHPALLEAAIEIVTFLEEEQIPYVIIWGLAVQHWSEPRLTHDVDITVMVGNEEGFSRKVVEHFKPRIPDAAAFARRSRVLLLTASNGCPIDISLGIPGYESEVMARAVTVKWPGSRNVRLISCEDLIIHKCVAGRPRDLEDVERVLITYSHTAARPDRPQIYPPLAAAICDCLTGTPHFKPLRDRRQAGTPAALKTRRKRATMRNGRKISISLTLVLLIGLFASLLYLSSPSPTPELAIRKYVFLRGNRQSKPLICR